MSVPYPYQELTNCKDTAEKERERLLTSAATNLTFSKVQSFLFLEQN